MEVRHSAPNPFRMPTDEEVFVLRDEERRQKTLERERLKYKRVHEKATWSARIASAKLKTTVDGLDLTAETKPERTVKSASALGTLPSVDVKDKDNMAAYIAKKREMGLIRMSLATKRQEIKKLDEEAERAEKRIRQQEEQLNETDAKFEAFLKHSDMEQVDAMKRAETETKAKQEKIQEIKKLSAQIAQIETDRKKNEEQLITCLEFKGFLDQLTPAQWFTDALRNIRVEEARRAIAVDLERQYADSLVDGMTDAEEAEKRTAMLHALEARAAAAAVSIDQALEALSPEDIRTALDALDPDLVPMYFTSPDQILMKFIEIEEGNLFLIQTCQELEEEIDDITQKYAAEDQEMSQIAVSRRAQMDSVHQRILVEQQKLRSLEERAERASDRTPEGGQSQEKLKEMIEEKIKRIFKSLGSGEESSLLGMLTTIETRMEDFRQQIFVPAEKGGPPPIEREFVHAVMRQSDKDRRQLARTILLNKQREEREKRSKAALARSQAEVKKRVGKPVMWRSKPLDRKTAVTTAQEITGTDEDEEFLS